MDTIKTHPTAIIRRLFPHAARLIALLPLLIVSAQAEPITFQFTGTANSVGAALYPYFKPGDPYTFTLSYDTTAPNKSDWSSDFGTYDLISASMIIEASGGTWNANLKGGDYEAQVKIENTGSYDRFEASHTYFSQPEVAGQTAFSWVLTMYTGATDTFASTALPTALNLADWSTNPSSTRFHIYFNGAGSDYNVRFNVAAINTLSAIPEPSTYAAIAGLLVLGGALWHRRRHRRASN